MADIEALRVQEYSTNLDLLSQQMTPKLANICMTQQAAGNKAFRLMSQIDKTDAVARATRAQPAINIDLPHTGRWVYPVAYDWGRVVDDIDLLQTNIAPQGAYVRSAVAAMNRKKDELFLTAFFGTAQTGETGSTGTNFSSANQVAHNFGTTESLTAAKMFEAQRILLANDIDLDMEVPHIAISPAEHSHLLALEKVTSDLYARPVLGEDGRVRNWMGFNIHVSNMLPLDSAGKRRLPFWVQSGMGCGLWKDLTGTIRSRPDLQGDPAYVEATMMLNYTRLEEAKCGEIKVTVV